MNPFYWRTETFLCVSLIYLFKFWELFHVGCYLVSLWYCISGLDGAVISWNLRAGWHASLFGNLRVNNPVSLVWLWDCESRKPKQTAYFLTCSQFHSSSPEWCLGSSPASSLQSVCLGTGGQAVPLCVLCILLVHCSEVNLWSKTTAMSCRWCQMKKSEKSFPWFHTLSAKVCGDVA